MIACAAALRGRRQGREPSAQRASRSNSFAALFSTWDSLFSDAAEFATALGRERLISISHSEEKGEGVVTVWYWK